MHGLIHIMGMVKEWGFGLSSQLNSKKLFVISPKLAGFLWLLVCMVLLLSAVLLLVRKDWYWIPLIFSITISQFLIITYWHDAKWGSVLNIILLILIAFAAASFFFNRMARKEAAHAVSNSNVEGISISSDMLQELPPVVQRWITNTQMVGNEFGSIVRLVQTGRMKTEPGGQGMSFDAEQTTTLDPPAFVWNARIHSFVDIAGRDKFENGQGNMLIKAASLIPIADAHGKEIDQGSMLRFMAEMIWYPQAAFNDYLDWEEIDRNHARVTMSYGDITASGVYTFNDDGFPIAFEAPRYREVKGKYSLETWSIRISEYRYFNGIPIGAHSEVTWRLKEGDFTWLILDIQTIEYSED